MAMSLDNDEYLLALLSPRASYNVANVKEDLRTKCPAFQALRSIDAQKIARRICRALQDRGDVWHSTTQPTQRDFLLKHPDVGILQRAPELFKALAKNFAVATHCVDHPIPFIGFEMFRSNRSSIEQIPDHARIALSDFILKDNAALTFCEGHAINLSKRVAGAVKIIPHTRVKADEVRWENLKTCVSLVYETLAQHPQVRQVLPIRIRCGSSEIHPQFLAALIYRSGLQYILPLRLWPVGKNSFECLRSIKHLAGWNNALQSTPEVMNAASDIFRKFRNYPILSIIDVVKLSSQSVRRYSHLWAYQDELGDAGGCHLSFPPYDRLFTSTCVLDLVFETCDPVNLEVTSAFQTIDPPRVKSRSGPMGLELVSDTWLSSLNCSLSDTAVSQTEMFAGEDVPASVHPLRSVFCEKSASVDGRLSCRLHRLCHLPPHHGSLYCRPHSIKLMEVYLSSPEVYDGKLSLQRIRDSRYDDQFDRLLTLRNHPGAWIIDIEYWSLAGDKSPVPWSISIRTLGGAIVVRTTVNYNMDLRALIGKVAPFTRRDGLLPHTSALKSLYSLARRHYQRDYTHGLTIEEIRSKLIGCEVVMSWGTVLDLQIFQRILHGSNDPIAPRCQARQEIDIFRIVQAALGPDFPSMALGDVHRCLVPGKVRQFHDADQDVMAVLDILERLYEIK